MISVILSCFNETNNPYFPRLLEQFKNQDKFELIVVDGGSSDSTHAVLNAHAIPYLVLENSTRAARLHHGIEQASFEHILLQHPRSLIEPEGIAYLLSHHAPLNWAAFKHRFDHKHLLLRYISWYSNRVRVGKKQITYLDHCIVLNRNCYTEAIPDIAIFEDTALSYQLQKHTAPQLLPFYATTSAIRFLDRGILRQFLMNQSLKLLYHSGVSPKVINRFYESKLNLNQINAKIF